MKTLKLPIIPLALMCAAGMLAAQQPPVASPTPAVRELADIPYVQNGGNAQKLDLYLPPESDTAVRPLVVWIHGGGWTGGNKKGGMGKQLVFKGYAVASIEYRFSQEAIYPAQIEDCKAAIRWLRAHASEYHIDPKHIGVWGASAGGHLVALLGTTGNIKDFDVGGNLDQSSDVQCVVDWFGPTDFLKWGDSSDIKLDNPTSPVAKLLGGTVTTRLDLARSASPLYFVTKDSAPFLIMHGDKDPTVPLQQSVELDAALQKVGVESALVIIPGNGHGGPGFSSPENQKMILDFFDRHLKPAPAP